MPLSLPVIALTFAGGALGTMLRVLLTGLTDPLIGLFIVNTLGTAALAFSNHAKFFDNQQQRAFWSVGFAGGFTTMSGIALWLAAPIIDLENLLWIFGMVMQGLVVYGIVTQLVKRSRESSEAQGA